MWIETKLQKPKYGEQVLCHQEGEIFVAEIVRDKDNRELWVSDYSIAQPTHWMPLPEYPSCNTCKNEFVACVCMMGTP